jgi:hypothetical protein
MREMTPRVSRTLAALALAFLLCAFSAGHSEGYAAEAPASPAGEETPLAVATRFARAFEKQDFAVVRALFAPDAMVSRVALSRDGEPRFYRFSSTAWLEDAERNHVHLRDVRLEILDSATQSLEQGAVVSMRYRFSGRAGNRSFVSDGIDTYSLVRMNGSWRVLQYSYIEKIEFS